MSKILVVILCAAFLQPCIAQSIGDCMPVSDETNIGWLEAVNLDGKIAFGELCIPTKGGTFCVVAIDSLYNRVLCEYKTSQAGGTFCPSGTLVFIFTDTFLSLQENYIIEQQRIIKKKRYVESLLKQSRPSN